MMIEYDNIINKWVVWLKDKSMMYHVYASKYKNECKSFVKDNYRNKDNKILVYISNKSTTKYKRVLL